MKIYNIGLHGIKAKKTYIEVFFGTRCAIGQADDLRILLFELVV